VTVTSAYAEPVGGGVISFVGPFTGAGTYPITTTATIAPDGAVSHSVTANGAAGGPYSVTASATGVMVPVGFTLTNNKIDTTSSLSSAPNPSLYGQLATFTATVTSATGATPTGTVQFYADGVTLGGAQSLASGIATYPTSTLAVGAHVITATYSGNSNFNTSSGALSSGQTVLEIPITDLSAANSSPTRLTEVTFFTATISAGNSVTYQWNFGDGQTGSGATTSHTYAAAGTYTAVVTATNWAGSISATTLVAIEPCKVYLPLMMR